MLNDANNEYNANKWRSNDSMHIICGLLAWADAYNHVMNAYNAHDAAGGS